MLKNDYVRFGRHVNIGVSYKISWLDALNKLPTLQNPPCFE
jgi:hypothetical protein